MDGLWIIWVLGLICGKIGEGFISLYMIGMDD